ncbi:MULTISPECIES: HAD family hydrolase [unclassified Bradyrhizobium]|uniref:HAD family hydrolase n=1 Tax=unclassified Bradyrhizobium TaxID=2631580 RepID=UPI002916372C|nr:MULTISPECIES: HAD family hydrolase [unclassified Bradyrhizobium]
MSQKLLITDLDNTLYDWVTFFTASFKDMVSELTVLLDVPEQVLLDEFKSVHQRYGNSEQPYAVLELPSLQRKFSRLSRAEILNKIDPALHRFNSTRKRTLSLYTGAAETLSELREAGVKIVGHTEAILANSYWRLRTLGVQTYLSRLYTLEGKDAIHISSDSRWVDPPVNFVTVVPRDERKPNPRLLLDICSHEGSDPSSAFYLGDSLVRDVAMAKEAGVTAIWARYGTKYDPSCWTYLVKVTHWTDQDVEREKSLKSKYGEVLPDHTIDRFAQLKSIVLGG